MTIMLEELLQELKKAVTMIESFTMQQDQEAKQQEHHAYPKAQDNKITDKQKGFLLQLVKELDCQIPPNMGLMSKEEASAWIEKAKARRKELYGF
jgi:hypothetical protein